MAITDTAFEIADGVYRCGSDRVNWYLIEEDDALTVVDTGFPTHWQQLLDRLDALGYELANVDACLLTHAHPDHIGFAERLREFEDIPVWLHAAGRRRARAGGDPPLGGLVKNLWRPAVLRYFVEVVQSDGTSIPPVTAVETVADGDELDVPGHPRVIHVPGHTEGDVAFYLPDRDALLCGDALATVDFETWQGNRPQLLPPWLNVDHAQARASLDRFESLGDVVLLPGHGDPWTGRLTETIRAEQIRS
ncbi:MBL fold metallo-hydrolase [Halomicrococcus gelatinilyticus]|uniref:MBL fold metallo-hydrolase n=1 Tax=Halomicrococcus gelatinilyticus TaxID=1702103 RepID=UPI002E0E95EF